MAPPIEKKRFVPKRPQTASLSSKRGAPSAKRQAVAARVATVSPAAASLAKKQANAVQVSIPFGVVEKYKVGLKVLLDESIYPTAASVHGVMSCLIVVLQN